MVTNLSHMPPQLIASSHTFSSLCGASLEARPTLGVEGATARPPAPLSQDSQAHRQDSSSSSSHQPIAPETMAHSNIKEAFREVQSATREAGAFRDWFHAFANILSLLGSRAGGNPDDFRRFLPRYQKLLKAELIRGQIQATYAREDSARLGRPGSPLVREGYGRAVRTGLWLAAAAVRTEQLCDLLKGRSHLLEDFEIFPVSRPFEYQGRRPDVIGCLEKADLAATEMAYIQPLGVQLIKKSQVDFDVIQSQFGRRGLRASPSECADICAECMMLKIGAGNIQGALQILDNAFDGESAQAVKLGLSKIELQPNTLMVPNGTDPLLESTPQQLSQLKEAYERCIHHGIEGMPFYLQQNIQFVSNLIGDIGEFCQPGIPSMICSDLMEALLKVAEMVSEARWKSKFSSDSQRLSRDMERLYQAMQSIHHVVRFQADWSGRTASLDEVVASLVLGRAGEPAGVLTHDDADSLRSCLTVVRAPHAMALLEQVRSSLPEQIFIACLANGYYETPTLFDKPLQCDVVTHADLPRQDLIIMEPHPNNAAKLHVQAHDPVALINHLFSSQADHCRTLVIDITLNHLAESQISLVLMAARPHIESGKLNLVLMQSATKFMQNGMDLASMGVALCFNNGACWSEFRASMESQKMNVPRDDLCYIASLLSQENKAASIAYLNRIRINTATLRGLLNARIPLGHREHNAYEVCINTDEQTVYIGLRPTNVYLVQRLGKASGVEVSPEERARVNIGLYHQRFRPAFRDLATVDRSSFGFNVTNFGECGETIRVTPGIEEPGLLHEYSRRIIALGASLYAEAFGLFDPNAVAV